eukprot:7049836-Prymnesium_polylepis.1
MCAMCACSVGCARVCPASCAPPHGHVRARLLAIGERAARQGEREGGEASKGAHASIGEDREGEARGVGAEGEGPSEGLGGELRGE